MAEGKLQLNCKVTGVGSLPPMSLDDALAWVREYTPELPYIPQLPLFTPGSGMLHELFETPEQFFETNGAGLSYGIIPGQMGNLLDLMADEGRIKPRRLVAEFATRFSLSSKYSPFLALKNQMVGPVALLLGLTVNNRPLVEVPGALAIVGNYLSWKITKENHLLEKFTCPKIWILDEPIVPNLGKLEKKETYPALIVQIREVCQSIKKLRAIPGIHCCGSLRYGVPFLKDIGDAAEIWSVPILEFVRNRLQGSDEGTRDISLLNAERIMKGKLFSGGYLLAGTVSTEESGIEIKREEVIHTINDLFAKEEKCVLNRLAVTGACGLGTLSIDKARTVVKETISISNALKLN